VMPTLIVTPALPRYCLRRRSEGSCAGRFDIRAGFRTKSALLATFQGLKDKEGASVGIVS
jgi:hypothetical protein